MIDSRHTQSRVSNANTSRNQPVSSKSVNHSKSPQASKENSFDASGSDSDENVLSGKLSPKDDIGYETGSFDDIDASSSDTLSPTSVNENRSILDKPIDESGAYSYADLEFRPLIVTDEGGVSSAVNTSKERLSYAYAGNEFRPLIITENGGIAGPVTPQTNENRSRTTQPVTSYEEVEIPSGNFDRSNLNITKLMPAQGYETVEISQENERTEQNVKAFDCRVGETVGDVYATVDKNRIRTPKEAEVLPELPSRREITRSDLYECITGNLNNMIDACDVRGDDNPPPLPKPYSGPGIVGVTADNENKIEGKTFCYIIL